MAHWGAHWRGVGQVGAVAVALIGAVDRLQAGELVLVDRGTPRAVIVTAAAPCSSATRAAAELQRFVELMSGARLPVYGGSGAVPAAQAGQSRLLVGRSPEVAALGVRVPSGNDRDVSREGFVLKTVGQDLVLAGNEDAEYRGTEYAVYELLERLGCRWYFPGEFGQVVPGQSTLRVPTLDVEQRPSFAVRNIWLSGWADTSGDHEQWLVRNKGTVRNGFAFPGDGTIYNLAPPELYAESLPEIYAVGVDGQRHPWGQDNQRYLIMLCVTNPKTVEVAGRTVREYFRAHPEANSYGFSAPDWAPRCHCEKCVAADHGFRTDNGLEESISDGYFNFVNNLAYEVAQEFPDRYLVVLAYDNRVRPPEGLDRPWHPNIIVHLAQLWVSTQRPIDDPSDLYAGRRRRSVEAWHRIAPRILIYDYDPHAPLSRMPYWNTAGIARDLPFYRRHGVIGFTTEANNTFLRTGLNYYLRARLMWNTEADVDAIKKEYYARFFGPAAEPMRRFIEGIEALLTTSPDAAVWTSRLADWSEIYPADRTAALGQDLQRAAELAGTEAVQTRVRAFAQVHRYMLGFHEMVARGRAGEYREALARLDALQEPMAAAEEIQRGLLPPDPAWVTEGQRGLAAWRWYYTELAERDQGPRGQRLALGPEQAGFRTDAHDVGLHEQWHLEEVAAGLAWDSVPVTRDWSQSGYRDAAGYAFPGPAWYRSCAVVPAGADVARARLYVPLVYADRMWVWLNGHLVYSPTAGLDRYGADIDVSGKVVAGAVNTVTFRMVGTRDRAQHHGLGDRWLLWEPAPRAEGGQ